MAYVRRKSSAFTRGKSRYRGVSGHSGRWEARIGTFGGRKNVRRAPKACCCVMSQLRTRIQSETRAITFMFRLPASWCFTTSGPQLC